MRRAVVGLLLLLLLLAAGARLTRWPSAQEPAETAAGAASRSPGDAATAAQAQQAGQRPRDLQLQRLADSALATQVARVVAALDRTGRPPAGVAQGGRRGGRRGLFENAEGRLPRQPRGYYTESDVWPPGERGRGPERLVLGREGEVYYSPDHYRSFVRLR